MNREEQDQALALAEELLQDIELDRTTVDKQVLKASRLARLMNDEKISDWLRRERQGYSAKDVDYTYFVRTSRKYMKSEHHVFSSAAQIQAKVETYERELASMRIPNVSGEWANKVNVDALNRMTNTRNMIVKQRGILASVSGHLHTFASATYHSLRFSTTQNTMFEKAKEEIDSLLLQLDENTLRRIDSAYSNLQAEDAESISGAMNSLRRLIDGFTDAVFPPTHETRPHPQAGKPAIQLGQQQRMNRLRAFIDDHALSKSRAKRLGESAESIYARVSNGVHNDASKTEADYLFLTTYVLLGEILNLKAKSHETTMTVTVGENS
ncbi:AbiTii domain-containing protein [Pseudarthrobacter sp. ATCC 49987]|uniref:AbiTii domain-containing protein n=1 Tax=Pseudarthrobacter sp. ATCC 49987 TaxID=2698204 RepID=UPI001367B175|nr:hypothetical protein [Pseudarthrobacter sp. ATCC 49987]